ncbi:hypothetical protein [Mycobacterium sp. E3247]|uniref:hypothetical protein n=1 Tax=Mycobacterium sp. E3247 TaxID=1856864 RepID=UPI000801790F|nr:hypothetical protein [Mycobacterium sp. E3247]OBH01491.1 hypothetical protein A9X04_27150 [Mycobacterium sp. E3247]
MSQQSTIARAAKLQRPGIAWIGRYRIGDDVIDFTVSEDDFARDTAWAAQVLRGHGISKGSHVLVTATPSETPWIDAFRVGAGVAGAVYSNAEPWNWDARRSEMYIRRLNTEMVIGLSAETVTAMGQITDAAVRLGSVGTILARPEALPVINDLGIEAGLYVRLGPAVAVTAPDRAGLQYDEDEWALETVDGQLVVSTVGPRATRFDRQPTGVAGEVTSTPGGARIALR